MKLLSWNVQWCRGVDGRVDPGRSAREARAMADADVICLQEVARNFDTLAGSAGEDQFALLAAAFPGYTAVEGVAVDVPGEGGSRRQFGNLLLSRLPLRHAWRRVNALRAQHAAAQGHRSPPERADTSRAPSSGGRAPARASSAATSTANPHPPATSASAPAKSTSRAMLRTTRPWC